MDHFFMSRGDVARFMLQMVDSPLINTHVAITVKHEADELPGVRQRLMEMYKETAK